MGFLMDIDMETIWTSNSGIQFHQPPGFKQRYKYWVQKLKLLGYTTNLIFREYHGKNEIFKQWAITQFFLIFMGYLWVSCFQNNNSIGIKIRLVDSCGPSPGRWPRWNKKNLRLAMDLFQGSLMEATWRNLRRFLWFNEKRVHAVVGICIGWLFVFFSYLSSLVHLNVWRRLYDYFANIKFGIQTRM